jgi:cyclic pyranopterin phosphate synthase
MEKINKTQSRLGYLFRASISDECNYDCQFCHPNDHEPVDILTNAEFLRIFNIVNDLFHIKTLHFTGGEPLMRRDLPELIAECRKIAGSDLEIALTTNGSLLANRLNELVSARLSRINVSLHSLNPKKYQEFTGSRYDINEIKKAINIAKVSGLLVKINSVVIRGFNYMDIPDMISYCFNENLIPRFLELGVYEPVTQWYSSNDIFTHNEILVKIQENFGHFERDFTNRGNGPTKYYKNNQDQIFGILDNQSDKSCRGCDRFRMSANGFIKVCNFPPIDLKPLLCSNEMIKDKLLQLGDVLHSRGQDYIGKRQHLNDYNFRWNHPELNSKKKLEIEYVKNEIL